MSFPAKFKGWCSRCDKEISVGDKIEYNADDEVVHVECPLVLPAPVCPLCWLTQPCEHTEAT